MVLIGGAEEWAAIEWEKDLWLRKGCKASKHAQPPFTLKMATAMFAETLNNYQHLAWFNPES
jgi:hypothetical protein